MQDLSQGNKTFGTVFKSQSDAPEMANKIEAMERDIASSKALCDLLTVYLGERILPAFKREKVELYRIVIQQYHVNEISNSHATAGFCDKML